ncbi:hypothetical protein Hanom_Chr13g01194841 [Helianthus anomalus]
MMNLQVNSNTSGWPISVIVWCYLGCSENCPMFSWIIFFTITPQCIRLLSMNSIITNHQLIIRHPQWNKYLNN